MSMRHLLTLFVSIIGLLLTACAVFEQPPLVTTAPPETATPVPPPPLLPTPTDLPFPWRDASSIASGICFEAAYDAAGQVFILRSPAELAEFYDLADNSQLCRRPVQRETFDFAEGRLLVGLWSRGVGCQALHEIEQVIRDDAARTFTIDLRFVTAGGCGYELVRPFWIALDDLGDYALRIDVE
jgi:hypothetical protein